jgi:4-hydroxy-2-oxoheptanedioate aldolase
MSEPNGAGTLQVGTVLTRPDIGLAEALSAEFDLLWIDLEHAALDLRDVEALTAVCQGQGCATYVRLPNLKSDRLSAILDIGIDGVVVPMIEGAEQASEFVKQLVYPPQGGRGFGPRRASKHGALERYWELDSARPRCVIQIETANAVEAASAIAAVEGVDALVVGCADLGLSLGAPGAIGDPRLQEAVHKTADAAEERGVAFGLAGGGEPADLIKLSPPDLAFLVYSVDARIYVSALRSAKAAIGAAASESGLKISARVGAEIG